MCCACARVCVRYKFTGVTPNDRGGWVTFPARAKGMTDGVAVGRGHRVGRPDAAMFRGPYNTKPKAYILCYNRDSGRRRVIVTGNGRVHPPSSCRGQRGPRCNVITTTRITRVHPPSSSCTQPAVPSRARVRRRLRTRSVRFR